MTERRVLDVTMAFWRPNFFAIGFFNCQLENELEICIVDSFCKNYLRHEVREEHFFKEGKITVY